MGRTEQIFRGGGYFEKTCEDISEDVIREIKSIKEGGLIIIDEIIINKDEMEKSNEYMYKNIKKRRQELIETHPDKKNLFVDYIRKQEG